MRRTLLPFVVATLAAPLHAALLGQPCARGARRVARPMIAMCSPPPLRTDAAVDVNSAASDLRKRLDSITLVESFVEATERGDAAATMRVCTDDFLYKTHRATTDSLAAAEDWERDLPEEVRVRTRTFGERVALDEQMQGGETAMPPARPQHMFDWQGNWALRGMAGHTHALVNDIV